MARIYIVTHSDNLAVLRHLISVEDACFHLAERRNGQGDGVAELLVRAARRASSEPRGPFRLSRLAENQKIVEDFAAIAASTAARHQDSIATAREGELRDRLLPLRVPALEQRLAVQKHLPIGAIGLLGLHDAGKGQRFRKIPVPLAAASQALAMLARNRTFEMDASSS